MRRKERFAICFHLCLALVLTACGGTDSAATNVAAPDTNGPAPAAEEAGVDVPAPTSLPEPTDPSEPTAVSTPAEAVAPAPTEVPAPPATAIPPLQLTSTAFAQDEPIPIIYSCSGEDISPPLAWSEPPLGTESFVLIMDDPDAPGSTWDHWLLFNVPESARELPENVPAGDVLDDGSRHGASSWGRNEYGGPCPPIGSNHRYSFRLYAMDVLLDLEAGAEKEALVAVMDGHILGEAELNGTFGR